MSPQSPVQFFIACLLAQDVSQEVLSAELETHFGKIDIISAAFPFNQTNYYESEMGPGLTRVFFSLEILTCPIELINLKKKSSELEKKWCRDEKRIINLDPGYLDAHKIVLSSFKFGGHKIALDNTIYADMVLSFSKHQFHPFDWTFPDFRSGIYFPFFQELRQQYLKKLQSLRGE